MANSDVNSCVQPRQLQGNPQPRAIVVDRHRPAMHADNRVDEIEAKAVPRRRPARLEPREPPGNQRAVANSDPGTVIGDRAICHLIWQLFP